MRVFVVLRAVAWWVGLAGLLVSCASPITAAGQVTPSARPSVTPIPSLTPTLLPTLPVPSAFHQSPHLENLVQARVIPPVKERLPEHPKVVRPVEQVGRYGGTWRMVMRPSADDAQFIRTVMYEPLVRWTPDWSGIEPNLAESYSVNHNATEYTLTLRRGLRWSDGEPFTTADIRFWYEQVLLNKELTLSVPAWLMSHTDVARFEFVDDYTFRVYFPYANSLFLEQLAAPDALMITAYPAHYARQFHAGYVPEELEERVKESGYSSWVELFRNKLGVNSMDHAQFTDPGRPRLSAWVPVDRYGSVKGKVIWERNPFYWKVDPEGNQLPYIDTVQFNLVNSADDAINQAMAGNIDMQNLSALGIDTASIFNDSSSPYRLYKLIDGENNVMVINLNLTHPDATLRELFQDKDFRIGLSYAINRQEILSMLYHGQGKPWQAAPREDSPLYDPLMSEQFTEYNPEKANESLDKAGYVKDQLGNRLGPDGQPISFSIEVLENEQQQIAMLNMIAKYWKDVGIDVQPKIDPLPIYLATIRSNQHDAAASVGGGTFFTDVLLDPSNYLPCNDHAYWALGWANTYNRVAGETMDQLDNPVRTALRMYDRVRLATSQKDQASLMQSALVISRESFWTIGIAVGPDQYGIIRKNFHNVPRSMPSSWFYPDPAPVNPEQFFMTTE